MLRLQNEAALVVLKAAARAEMRGELERDAEVAASGGGRGGRGGPGNNAGAAAAARVRKAAKAAAADRVARDAASKRPTAAAAALDALDPPRRADALDPLPPHRTPRRPLSAAPALTQTQTSARGSSGARRGGGLAAMRAAELSTAQSAVLRSVTALEHALSRGVSAHGPSEARRKAAFEKLREQQQQRDRLLQSLLRTAPAAGSGARRGGF